MEFMQQTITIVSDGSFKDDTSTYATILVSQDKRHRMLLTCPVPANTTWNRKNTDPFRSELLGVYTGISILYTLEKYTGAVSTITLSCDNNKALRIVEEEQHVNVTRQHFDLARAIIHKLQTISSRISCVKVEGHSDIKSPKRKRTRLERLNQACDKIAKITRSTGIIHGPIRYQGKGLSLWKGDRKIYADFKDQLRQIYYLKKAKPIVCRKF